jgi:stearoyl-CoA desaturase (delta-9 desaturase)
VNNLVDLIPQRPGVLAKTIASDRLARAQATHASAVVVLALIGALIAVGLPLAGFPVTAIDLVLFATGFVGIGLGSAVGYHRLFTHRSFKARPAVRTALAILGSMTMQGPVIFWVALHRLHHEHADGAGDPHSPHVTDAGTKHAGFIRGLWHGYIGWTFVHEVPNTMHYAPDLLRDPAISRINRQYFMWVLLGLLAPAAIGWLLSGSWHGALSGFAWGGALRVFAWHNMTWFITCFTHVFGSRDYHSGDLSTNNVWLALPTLGEAWHNNHHAFPSAAILSFEWWQFDFCGAVIRGLEVLNLAWDVNRPSATAKLQKRNK